MKKNKEDLVNNWLKKASRDLITSQKLLTDKESFNDIICFHAQQAGEKYLKAYLVKNDIDFPKTHSIEDLILLASKIDKNILKYKDDWIILTPYAVDIRYGEGDDPFLEDAVEAVKIAAQIETFITAII